MVSGYHEAASLPELQTDGWSTTALPNLERKLAVGRTGFWSSGLADGVARPVDRLVAQPAGTTAGVDCQQQPLPALALGAIPPSGFMGFGASGSSTAPGLAASLRVPARLDRELRGRGALWGHLLSSRQLALPGPDHGPKQTREKPQPDHSHQTYLCSSATP